MNGVPAQRTLSRHANARRQQRSVPPAAIDFLLQFGRRAHDHRGAILIFFDKRARKRMQKYFGNDSQLLTNGLTNAYVVLDDSSNTIITAGWRTKRLARD